MKLPRLGGGREMIQDFLKKNLRYPKEALEKGIEGDVIVKYRVNGKGEVLDPRVVHGPGHGCDEEALRLVSMLQYEGVKNRGLKVTTSNRMKIPFRIDRKKKNQGSKFKMNYTPSAKTEDQAEKKADSPSAPKSTYGYTITLGDKP
ncbi:MAG: energy transducer TonB [Bacteroidales bacterium]